MKQTGAVREALALLALLIGACERTAPKLSDSEIQKLGAAAPGMTQDCVQKIRLGGLEAMPKETDQCFQMEAPKTWRGLWRYEFDNSRFCPEPANRCTDDALGERIWLTHERDDSVRVGSLYAVELLAEEQPFRGSMGIWECLTMKSSSTG